MRDVTKRPSGRVLGAAHLSPIKPNSQISRRFDSNKESWQETYILVQFEGLVKHFKNIY